MIAVNCTQTGDASELGIQRNEYKNEHIEYSNCTCSLSRTITTTYTNGTTNVVRTRICTDNGENGKCGCPITGGCEDGGVTFEDITHLTK